jgi:hypothetical protein
MLFRSSTKLFILPLLTCLAIVRILCTFHIHVRTQQCTTQVNTLPLCKPVCKLSLRHCHAILGLLSSLFPTKSVSTISLAPCRTSPTFASTATRCRNRRSPLCCHCSLVPCRYTRTTLVFRKQFRRYLARRRRTAPRSVRLAPRSTSCSTTCCRRARPMSPIFSMCVCRAFWPVASTMASDRLVWVRAPRPPPPQLTIPICCDR